MLPEGCFLDLRTAWRSDRVPCCRTQSRASRACAWRVHVLLMEDTGTDLAESCRSRESCQDTWWLCRPVSCLKLNYCLIRSSQMWPWNWSVMTDSKNNPLIISSPVTNSRFCFSSRYTSHNFIHTHFLTPLTALCSPCNLQKLYSPTKRATMQSDNKKPHI